MQSISVLLDVTKIADVSRAQRVCHVIDIFFGSSLGKIYLCQMLLRVCVKDFREEQCCPIPPYVSSPEKAHPE